MDKFEGYFSFDAHGELTKVADFPCVLLNDPDKLPDSSQVADRFERPQSVKAGNASEVAITV